MMLGLVLSGGGARGAYQAGVLVELLEIAGRAGISAPFRVITGVSAGAINAAYLASHAYDPLEAARRAADLWAHLESKQVYRTDMSAIWRIAGGWARDILSGVAHDTGAPRALLDTRPLADLLASAFRPGDVESALTQGYLEGFAITATDYAANEAVTFYQTSTNVPPWRRRRRRSCAEAPQLAHVLASSAIPLFFPPVRIGDRYYGDGCLRNTAPLSPALRLGASRLVVVGVRHEPPESDLASVERDQPGGPLRPATTASISRVLSTLINAVMMDALDIDLERLARINRTLSLMGAPAARRSELRSIDAIYLHPSEDLATVALQESGSLPKTLRFLLSGLGSLEDGADVLSYLMFEAAYCARLVELGRRDALTRREEIEIFLRGATV